MQPSLTPTALSQGTSNRVQLIDILRGFALLGIVINHAANAYLAGATPAGKENFNIHNPADGVMNFLALLLTFGKFFTIFSFLFGLSFAIQLENAAGKNQPFTIRFLWRLLILFAIGFVHNLFYSGDILVVYAALGVFLLPARLLSNKWVLAVALLLVLNVPAAINDTVALASPATGTPAPAGPPPEIMARAAEEFRIKSSGTLPELVRMNAASGLQDKFSFQIMTGRLSITFGLFLLGMYAWRNKLFVYTEKNRRFFKRLLWISGVATLAATAGVLTLGMSFGGRPTIPQAIGNFCLSIHQAALSTFYVSLLVVLYWKKGSKSRLSIFAPVGKIGLSTYLMQTAFGLLLFYGIGLGGMEKIGITTAVALAIAFFVMQVFFARWWTQHFQFGLAEWLWRSLTYGRVQPLRKKQQAPAPVTSINPSVIVLDSKTPAP
ncbi:uncharacterized protein SAMN05444008_105226 [Cnuella takakiae]|uniref:DUF418 domain-containing protein n=1 Tax=Cnuella takakiae TaxID=1302690 RepID=A0A1M4ZHN3_9BACT|nr:DUF418 domain-containing protein [Cnuella takakiae]OLY94208.1 hypothetical protein BUE76_21705 [Cnuella takakiae]SHF17544.1 uncharacterized protein SAMN05444008_105226 [Cnuella takakiae]